ncbi:hypothetical protein ACH5RR_039380 [Cinchona calisaya]|uniref:Uncharacterized protein n=1 Tax=Cinchona calisaya TaxID=153742 RepID=A0ABD2Y1I0_9GENT
MSKLIDVDAITVHPANSSSKAAPIASLIQATRKRSRARLLSNQVRARIFQKRKQLLLWPLQRPEVQAAPRSPQAVRLSFKRDKAPRTQPFNTSLPEVRRDLPQQKS